MKKTISLALVILMCVITACAKPDGDNNTFNLSEDDVDSISESETETSIPEIEYSYKSILPVYDFDGAEYVIAASENGNMAELATYELTTNELNGEIINDAVYNRNLNIETTYNVKINEIRSNTTKDDVLRSVSAGDSAYQLVNSGWGSMAELVCGGYLRDWNGMDYIDISQPWYLQQIREGTDIGGRVYLELNYIPFTGLLYTHCIFFNKQAVLDHGLQSPYELVDNGQWTIDVMNGYVKDMNRDLNGDGVFDDNDYYGYMTSLGGTMVMTYAFQNPTVSITSDNKVSLDLNTERFSTSIDKVLNLCYSNSGYVVGNDREAALAKMFANRQSLLYAGFMSDTLLYFRDMDDDYGMLIFPKFDEKQEEYYTKVGGGSFVLGIPAVCGDEEMVAIITEALAIESYNTIKPAVYEISLSYKGLRDTESYASYELIMKNIMLDFGQLYRMGKNDYIQMLQTCLDRGENTLSSLAASLEPAYNIHYQDIVDIILTLPQ